MAGTYSDYTENKVLELVCGKTAFATPGSHLGIWSTNPTTFENTTNGVEATGSNYGRQSVTWGTASGGSISNSTTAIAWTVGGGAGVGIAAGTYTGWSVWDAATVGNMLFGDAFGSSKTLASGDVLNFAIGSLTVTQT
jgi:hypothetical protein